MIARSRLVAPLLVLVAGLLLAPQANAADWDRFPGKRSNVGIKKRFDGPKYTDLRRCLRGLDSRVDADYFAGLVDITDKEGSRSREADDARPYADALFEEWGLDDSEDVLIVVGIRNRSLGVRPGEKWQKLGLDERTIDETVDASDYQKYRRRGDYGEAICSLATALDYRLAALDQSMKRRIERIGSRLPKLEDQQGALSERVEKAFPEEHEYGDSLREQLELAATFLADAKETLEEEPTKAVNLADNAGEKMGDVREKLQTYNSKAKVLDDIDAQIKSLERQIRNRADADRAGPQEALGMLEECKTKVEQTRQTLENDPSSIRVCIAEAEARLARADVHHEYRSEVVPTVIAVALTLIGLIVVVALFLRRRRTMQWVEPELAEWQRNLDDAGARIDELVGRFPEFFSAREPWVGESQALDERIRYHTTLVALLLERGAQLVRQARETASSPIPLAILGPEKSLGLLRDEDISLEAGTTPQESPITSGLPRGYQATSNELQGDLFAALVDASMLLEGTSSQLDAVFELRDKAGRLQEASNAAVSVRQELGLPMLDIQADLDALADAHQRARQLVERDPLAAEKRLEDLVERLETTVNALEDANEAYRQVTGPLRERGDALRKRIRELKRKGIEIDESGFDPASELDASARLAERIEALARQGDGEHALERTHELSDELEDLESLIAVSEEAEDVIPETIEAIKEQRDALKSDILKVRVALGRAQEDSGGEDGRMARVSQLQASLSDKALYLNRIRRALHKGELLTAAADTSRTVTVLERGRDMTLQLAEDLGVERDTLQTPESSWPPIWTHSSLAGWHSARFGAARSSDLPW